MPFAREVRIRHSNGAELVGTMHLTSDDQAALKQLAEAEVLELSPGAAVTLDTERPDTTWWLGQDGTWSQR